jgi:Tfp pilus assembly protein PilF
MSWQRAAFHRQRAGALEASGHSVEAVEAYREALRCDPENADAQRRLGLLLRELGHDEEANQAFAAAQRLHSGGTPQRPQQQVLALGPEGGPNRPAGGSGNIGP